MTGVGQAPPLIFGKKMCALGMRSTAGPFSRKMTPYPRLAGKGWLGWRQGRARRFDRRLAGCSMMAAGPSAWSRTSMAWPRAWMAPLAGPSRVSGLARTKARTRPTAMPRRVAASCGVRPRLIAQVTDAASAAASSAPRRLRMPALRRWCQAVVMVQLPHSAAAVKVAPANAVDARGLLAEISPADDAPDGGFRVASLQGDFGKGRAPSPQAGDGCHQLGRGARSCAAHDASRLGGGR